MPSVSETSLLPYGSAFEPLTDLKQATSLYDGCDPPPAWSTKTTNVHESPPPASLASQAPAWPMPPSQFALSYATAGSSTAIAVSLPVSLNGISLPGPICLL